MQKKRLVVVGGGAAGFFCAVNAASQNPELEVIIIEKTNKLLSKVRVSGGGRCNVTHACFSVSQMVKKYPRGENFLKHAFHHFFTVDTIEWFRKRKVLLKTEADGRMFPESNSSETIIACLVAEADHNKVQIRMNHEVVKVETMATDERDEKAVQINNKQFTITFKDQPQINADFICIACGGYSKGQQFAWLTGLGHSYEYPVPSLFTFNIASDPITALMGITLEEVMVKVNDTKFSEKGPLLITHWGFSGPAILRLSAFAAKNLADLQYNFSISINWLPAYNESSLLVKLKSVRHELASQKIGNRNPLNLPNRLWQYHLKTCQVDEEIRWADLPAKQQNLLSKQLCSQQFHIKGKTTFKEEFVTAGGIRLDEIDPHSMQSKIIPNIFFAGEIMDVDGITGGFNFQHAWTSGWIAAKEITNIMM